MVHTINLTGYSAAVQGENLLQLGTWDSYGIEQLQIVPGPEWADLTITATFVTPTSSTRMVVPALGLVDVPPEATAQALTIGKPGCIVFAGVSDGVQRISTNIYYTVANHAPVEGSDSQPTPSEWEQFVAQVQQSAQQAAQSESNAAASATAAAGSAADAAAALGKVQDAGTAALTAIGTAQASAVGAVQQAGQTAIQQVQDAGTAQVNAVNAAGDAKLQQIADINALLPTPTETDAGKAVVVSPDGSGYELGDVQVDAYTKSESDARYAPIEAAIKVSGKGTGVVSLSPTVAWGMQGLKLYGRSWQDGTPSVETEVPIQSAGQSGSSDVQITNGGSQSQYLPIPTPGGLPGIPVTSGGNWVDENGQQWVSDVVDFQRGIRTQFLKKILFSDLTWEKHKLTGTSSSRFVTHGLSDAKMEPNPSAPMISISNMFSPVDGNILYRTEVSAMSGYYEGGNCLFVKIVGVTELSDFLEKTKDATLLYPLATPITTPLDAETIAAYEAMQSYPGTTNIIASDAGIEAAAVAEPNQYIEDRIQAAITQAVTQAVTLTGGNT